ncbi:hypothetical protein BDM02DRAFT_3192589 [Thelephora ganbajun]|uniref:Uncharacterized protein n=1 Tax=Thelephora ganbajun TaxID=370292 RepID=A0ACB6Z150_THEGA|nr:hypothetical protein BDM02DRAFT_3192589 [Thelephora ganbajun]
MSQKWAFQGINMLTKHVNTELRCQIHELKLLFLFSHNNINPSTIYLIPGSENVQLDNRTLQEQ